MAILSDRDIKRYLEEGLITIDPLMTLKGRYSHPQLTLE